MQLVQDKKLDSKRKMARDESSPSLVQRYSSDLESFDIGDTKVQHFGLLMKKPFGHKSTRWQKR